MTKTAKNSVDSAPVDAGIAGPSMPESLEAEAAVLGSMILDRECIGQTIGHLSSESFYRPSHQIIFNSLISLYEKNSEIDLILLRDELKKRKKLNEVGGVDYLVRIAESVPSSASVEYYADIVKNKSLVRELIAATNEILREAYDESGEIAEKLDEAEKKIFAVTEKKIVGAAVPFSNLILEAYEHIEAREGKRITGLPTGYYELDDMLCGLQNGEMAIIAGRPSMGKTSFALNVAEHIGADNDIPIVIFSLEMGKQQLAERFLCSRGKINLQNVRRGVTRTDDMVKLKDACSSLFEKPIFIDDSPGLTPLMIRAKCRRLKSQHDIGCVIIDYLQLMTMGGKVESRQQEISGISRYLKGLARELNIPVIVLSQLNRSPEGREGHRPRMSDLRESGSIEQDADVVMLLHRDDYYHRGEDGYEDSNTADLIIAKQRNGPTGTVKLHFDSEFTRFENAAHIEEPF